MTDMSVVDLSRLQFAATALYHFLFVPLTLGLSLIIAIMESVYVMTGREVWRRMTLFWGTCFGINFALGVATGIVMEFQFGMNWSYYSHYVGDVFGAPLAIEGLMAFFLEATFIGLFFFGWDRLPRAGHLAVTWLVALGANLSALWILIANGWMQNPVGATFNPDTMRMEIQDFAAVIFNPVAQAKFVHTVSAGYVTGAMFVMSVSAIYLLLGRHVDFAKRSMAVASSFGLAAALSVVVLGDESGYVATEHQKMKLAAMEAMWHTQAAPAGIDVFAVPNQETHANAYEVKIPFVAGLITTRSVSTQVPGIFELVQEAKGRIQSGIVAFTALDAIRAARTGTAAAPAPLRAGENDGTAHGIFAAVDATKKGADVAAARAVFASHWRDLGYGLLLKRYTDDVAHASDELVTKAAWDTVPDVGTLFWSFRAMVACGVYFILFFGSAFWLSTKHRLGTNRGWLWLAVCSLPLPWVAIELGWIVAEYGRQPWVVEGVLPTFYAASGLTLADLAISLAFFLVLYTALASVEVVLMVRTIRHGPAARPAPEAIPGGPAIPAWAMTAPKA